MAAGSPGAQANIDIGFTPNATDVIALGGTTLGHPAGDVTVRAPFTKSFIRAGLVRIKSYITSKDFQATFGAREILLANLKFSWYNTAHAAGPPAVLTINESSLDATAALLLDTYAPNGTWGQRVISVPKAESEEAGDYIMPRATEGEDSEQSLAFTMFAIGDTASTGLLATITDTYA